MHVLKTASSTVAWSTRSWMHALYVTRRDIKIRRDDPSDVEDERPKKKIPAKVMWYARIIPHLKHLFINRDHAKLLRWHKEDRKVDNMLRHPVDGS
jgi:hypothetical protein